MEKKAIPEIRARRVGEIIDAAFKVWGSNLKTLVPLAAWIALPFELISALIAVSVKPTVIDVFTEWQTKVKEAGAGETIAAPKFTAAQIGAMASSSVINLLAGIAVTAALTSFIGQLVLSGTVERGDALRAAVRRGPIMLLSSLLSALIAGVVMTASFLPALLTKQPILLFLALPGAFVGLWMAIRLSAGGPAVVLEKAGPVQALRRSFFLTKGRFWAVVGATMVTAFIVAIPAGILTQIIKSALSGLGGNNAAFDFVWTAVASTVGVAVTSPITAAVAVFLYFDLRVRREGFDLQRLASDLSGAPRSESTPPSGTNLL